jgi:hypothetical protein
MGLPPNQILHEEERMARRIAGLMSAIFALTTTMGPARADVVVTLEAFSTTGQPVTGPVAPGTDVTVDILLSADVADSPLADVRLIQFDFAATSPGIQLVSYTWSVDANAYSFQDAEFPLTSVTSILFGSGPGLLALTTEPVKVGSVDITVDASGTLDAVNPENTDANFGAEIRASFTANRIYRSDLGNLQGGSLDFPVTGDAGGGGGGGIGGIPQPNDLDGDGVIDAMDAFPTNPAEAIDTNNDGVGNNADPDDDSDGVMDEEDAFPIDPAETTDTNGDGVGDNEDTDRDGDNVANDGDAFPDDPTETMDTDDDGTGNNADTDDDNDGIEDADDAFPLDPNRGGPDGENTATGSQPRMCGAGMLGSSMLMLLSLGFVAYRPRLRF